MAKESSPIFKLTFGEWVLLVGGVLSVGASHARIGMNGKNIEANKVHIDEQVRELNRYHREAINDIKVSLHRIKESHDTDHDDVISLKSDVKHILQCQAKMTGLLEESLRIKTVR